MADIDINLLGALQEMWSSKNWEFPTAEDKATAFDNLCKMFALLTSPQQQLVLKLTQAYSLHSYTSYLSLLICAFGKITKAIIDDADQIILAPLVNPGDVTSKRSKSGHSLTYPAEHVAIPRHQELKGIKVVSLASPDAIEHHISSEKKSLLILLDDFIGSGDTAKAAVQHLQSRFHIKDTILVIALVAMDHAIKRLATYNICVLSAEITYKGIEENPSIADKTEAYGLIDGIEMILDITSNQRRGYMKSEALISMMRTPDNTFPIYWCRMQANKSSWPAPFPR